MRRSYVVLGTSPSGVGPIFPSSSQDRSFLGYQHLEGETGTALVFSRSGDKGNEHDLPADGEVEHELSGPFTPQWGRITLVAGKNEASSPRPRSVLAYARAFCLQTAFPFPLGEAAAPHRDLICFLLRNPKFCILLSTISVRLLDFQRRSFRRARFLLLNLSLFQVERA